MVAVQEKYRFTVEEYYRMGEAGILSPDVRVELVDGEIRRMPPIDPPHANVVDRLTIVLAARLAGVAHLRVQGPIHLDDYNEPQPDLTVMRFRDDYSRRHPTPADVLLAIEFAETSLRYDRDEKMPRYGRYGIPEAWLIDVQAQTITVFTEPHAGGYGHERVLSSGQEIMFVAVEGLRVSVEEALG